MPPGRSFDYAAVQRRHAAGESIRGLAREFGVTHSAIQYALRRTSGVTCPRCGERKVLHAVLCDACRRSGRYGKDIGEEWDLFVPTVLSDISPPPNYLTYTPEGGGRYVIDTTWGYEGIDSSREEDITGSFFVTDTVTGRVELQRDVRIAEARSVFAELVAKVRRMNAEDAAAKNGCPV